MYLIYRDGEPVYIPEDGVRRCSAMTGSVRKLDPPQRRAGVRILDHNEQEDTLLRGYLAEQIERGGRGESKPIRSFLKTVNAVCANGNELGILIRVRATPKREIVEVYAGTREPGRIEWLPALRLRATEKLKQIMRETGPNRILSRQPEKRDLRARVTRPPKLKVETELIPGIRI